MGNPWTEGCWRNEPLNETTQLLPEESTLPREVRPVSTCEKQENAAASQVSGTSEPTKDQLPKVECQLLENNIENANHNSHDVVQNENEYFSCSNVNVVKENDNENHFNSVSVSVCSSDTNFTSTDLKTTTKERHISIDSARDSGIGDSCNLTDSCSSNTKNDVDIYDSSHVGMANFWEPKLKRSLEARLPENTYYLVPPNRYIFPGAEVFYDPDENYTFSDDESSDSDSSDNDSSSDNDETKVDLQSFTTKHENSESNE